MAIRFIEVITCSLMILQMPEDTGKKEFAEIELVLKSGGDLFVLIEASNDKLYIIACT
jgi:hypothetical protein